MSKNNDQVTLHVDFKRNWHIEKNFPINANCEEKNPSAKYVVAPSGHWHPKHFHVN